MGVDFSAPSELAVAHGRHLAMHFGAELRLVHVTPLLESVRQELSPGREHLHDSIHEASTELLAHRVDTARREGIATEAVILDGNAGRALADYALEYDIDLLLAGTHGRTGLRRFLLGSVSERLIQLAPCSILVPRGTAPDVDGYRNILVPTDFSELSEVAVGAAMACAGDGARVRALHCWEIPYPLPAENGNLYADVGGIREQRRREVSALAETLRGRYSGRNVMFDVSTIERSPTHGIAETLDSGHFDLAVIGSHGRSGIARWALGSIAATTTRHAPCSVLVVKTPAA